MVGTAEGESFQGPDGILQVATIWPGLLASEQTTEAGCRGWPQGLADPPRDGGHGLLVWASALVTEKQDRNLKETRGPGQHRPGRDRRAVGRKSGGMGLSGPGSAPTRLSDFGEVASLVWVEASFNYKDRELSTRTPRAFPL